MGVGKESTLGFRSASAAPGAAEAAVAATTSATSVST